MAGARLARTVGNPTAKSAIDMAIWDALGRTLGLPVSDLLGGYTDRMRVSHMLGFDDPAKMVAEAERMLEVYGIRTFKIKVGRRPVSLDTAVVRALRERFGDAVELYVDGNRGWTASESLRAMREMADLDLLFAEELCPADDVLGRRWLVGQLEVPFIADESVPTPADVTREVLGGSATAISIKTARTGFTQSQRVHHLAEGLGLEVVMGNQIDGQIGTAVHDRVRRRLPTHLTLCRRTVQLPRHERRPADRAAADPRRAAAPPTRRRARHRDRPGQTRPLPHRPVKQPKRKVGEQQ